MARVATRLRFCSAAVLACASVDLCAPAAAAPDLLSGDTLQLSGDVRLVAVDGERSWVDGGLGKLRSGSHGEGRLQPQLGNVSLAWQPHFTWALGATVVGTVQGAERTEAGLSQAFLTYKPMRSST